MSIAERIASSLLCFDLVLQDAKNLGRKVLSANLTHQLYFFPDGSFLEIDPQNKAWRVAHTTKKEPNPELNKPFIIEISDTLSAEIIFRENGKITNLLQVFRQRPRVMRARLCFILPALITKKMADFLEIMNGGK